METFNVKTHTDSSGKLTLELSTELQNRDVDVVIVLRPVSEEPVDAMGYPVGYFDETYGSFADEPIERGPQGDYEVRETLE